MHRMLAVLTLACALVYGAEEKAASWPLWDGQESIEQYAARANLPATKTLDLGNGENLELMLIPAGKFVMGTPFPEPVDERPLREGIVYGQALFAASAGGLLVLVSVIVGRAIRQRRRPQYSLARWLAMTVVAGVGVMGGMHWRESDLKLAAVRAEYRAAAKRYESAENIEKPAHVVTISKPFHMSRYETTQAQYEQVMGENPSFYRGAIFPVEMVSHEDATKFCEKVGERTAGVSPARAEAGGTPAVRVRLPTEAEWEYACRAGTRTACYSGDTEGDLADVGWYLMNGNRVPHGVGQKVPNAFGLHDMLGNVWEWCLDDYSGPYTVGEAVDPCVTHASGCRMLRGGSWAEGASACRCAARKGYGRSLRSHTFGFRVVVEAERQW